MNFIKKQYKRKGLVTPYEHFNAPNLTRILIDRSQKKIRVYSHKR